MSSEDGLMHIDRKSLRPEIKGMQHAGGVICCSLGKCSCIILPLRSTARTTFAQGTAAHGSKKLG